MSDKKPWIEEPYMVPPDPPQNKGAAVPGADHYVQGGLECIDAIKDIAPIEQYRGFCRWSAFKYIWRADKKDNQAENARKAIDYLQWYAESYEEGSSE